MEFEFDNPELTACQEVFNALDSQDRLFKTHYELANETGIDSTIWKAFLMDTRVANWMEQELILYKNVVYRKTIKNAGTNGNSYGTAQMINALKKSFEGEEDKEGNIFVYMQVPLNSREQQAPNTQRLAKNIFEEDD